MSIEKKFQYSLNKLKKISSDHEFSCAKKPVKQSVFFNFAKNIKDDQFIQALESKIEAIIISNPNHKQATKLIMELVWVTRNKWKYYENRI